MREEALMVASFIEAISRMADMWPTWLAIFIMGLSLLLIMNGGQIVREFKKQKEFRETLKKGGDTEAIKKASPYKLLLSISISVMAVYCLMLMSATILYMIFG